MSTGNHLFPNNSKLILIFKYLKVYREIQGEEHSALALNKIIESMEKCHTNIINGKQAKEILKGVGQKSIFYIDSILSNKDPNKSGLRELDTLNEENRNKLLTIFEMVKIPGIGTITAKSYYENGFRNVEELKQILLTHGTTRQQLGVEYMTELEKRIPRAKVELFINNFNVRLTEFNNHYQTRIRYDVGGSYCRGEETSGDIDIILWSLIPRQISSFSQLLIDYLKRCNLLKDTLSHGSMIYQGIAYIDEEFSSVRIDFKMLHDINEYYYAILYFTGPGKFNEEMREKAKSMGLTLGNNEMKITSTGEKINVRCEKDIFDILGIEWKPANQR